LSQQRQFHDPKIQRAPLDEFATFASRPIRQISSSSALSSHKTIDPNFAITEIELPLTFVTAETSSSRRSQSNYELQTPPFLTSSPFSASHQALNTNHTQNHHNGVKNSFIPSAPRRTPHTLLSSFHPRCSPHSLALPLWRSSSFRQTRQLLSN
jgi:hypothetical protein